MFLAIDAGNSNIVFGFYDESLKVWTHEFRITTSEDLTVLHLEKQLYLFFLENDIKIDRLTAAGISSVVPAVNTILERFCREFLSKKPFFIKASSYRNIPIQTNRPDEIGTDLMCNAMAAFHLFKTATIIVDFGTALTFTVVSDQGKILGVNIVPGLRTAIKALFSNTAKLPEVALELPASALGKDTIHSIQAGILYGYTGLVKGMLQTIQDEVGHDFRIIATGGLSSILTTLKDEFESVDKMLTLEGIRLITMANKGSLNSDLDR